MRWLQARKSHHGLVSPQHEKWIKWVTEVLKSLDPELISRRSVDCKDYARALFFLEPHLETKKNASDDELERLLGKIQDIYTEIDDPDGLEGVSAHLVDISLDQQALNHRKAGRWTAAQTWYEIRFAESPDNVDIQLDLLTCLKESGQHGKSLKILYASNGPADNAGRCPP